MGWIAAFVGVRGANRALTGAVTALAGLAALVLAVALPATTFLAERYRVEGALETSARLYAAEVAIVAAQTPGFWQWHGIRLSTPLAKDDGAAVPERRRVYDASGRLVLETASAGELRWPVLAQREPIMDGATRLGAVEAARSFRSQLIITVLVGIGSTIGGLLIFIVLRVVPLRLLREALDRASYLAAHDVLTGLPNRALFADRLSQALAMAPRAGRRVAVLCLDLDHFKKVNDTLGHAAGDSLLRIMAARMAGCLREGDTLCRLGGDEFTVILPDCHDEQDAEVLASRLLETAVKPVDLSGDSAHVGLSIGVALSEPHIDAGQMLKNADVALYQAKGLGRNRWCFFAADMNERLMERQRLEADLRKASANGEFFVHFQPLVELRSGRIIGAEALLRWNRPEHGVTLPDAFINVAEEIGIIGDIGAWVLQEACQTAVQWPEPLNIAVNVSPLQFRLSGFLLAIDQALESSRLPASRLQIEITENVLLNDTEETLATLMRLRERGVRLAMDDFGTGYSSLGYLQRFRFDKIKIDRSFVRRLASDPDAAAIVRAVISLGHAMGVHTNAEGVETREEAWVLLREGCEEGQGFLYGQPMTGADFLAMLGEQAQRPRVDRVRALGLS